MCISEHVYVSLRMHVHMCPCVYTDILCKLVCVGRLVGGWGPARLYLHVSMCVY